MGLKARTIRKAVEKAFKVAGEMVQTATYRRKTSTYNPANGQLVTTNTDYSVPMILTGFSQYEIDRVTVLAFDTKAMIETRNLPVTPVVATDSVIVGGKTYNIVRYIKDPSNSVITLHLRAP